MEENRVDDLDAQMAEHLHAEVNGLDIGGRVELMIMHCRWLSAKWKGRALLRRAAGDHATHEQLMAAADSLHLLIDTFFPEITNDPGCRETLEISMAMSANGDSTALAELMLQ